MALSPPSRKSSGTDRLYAQEQQRTVDGSLIRRDFGPASPTSQRVAKTMRRTIAPTIGLWRPTGRGLRFAQRTTAMAPIGPVMKGATIEHQIVGGVHVEWTTAPKAREAEHRERVILMLHGGGYVIGSARQYRPLSTRISQVTATPVVSVDYRMVPVVSSIQQTRADAFAAYRGLLDLGYPPEAIIVLGDSAGGGLASYVTLQSLASGLGRPAATLLLSPWVDMTDGGPSRHSNRRTEVFIGGDVLDRISRALVPDPAERAFWHNSPLFAPVDLLREMPPTLIQVSDVEVLSDDGYDFAAKLRDVGVKTELQTFAGQGHVVAMWNGVPEARRALRELSGWLRETLPSDRRPDAPSEAEIEAAAESGTPPPATGMV